MPPTFQSAVALAKQKQLRAADAEFKELAFSSSRIFGFDAAVASVRGALARAETLLAQAGRLGPGKVFSQRHLLNEARLLVQDDSSINDLHAKCEAQLAEARRHFDEAVKEANAGHLKKANAEIAAAHAIDAETPEICHAYHEISTRYQQHYRDTRHLRVFGYCAAALVAALVLGIGGYFMLRDTWEADHGGELLASSAKALQSDAAQHDFEAIEAANEAIVLVGDHPIENKSLREALESAKRIRAGATSRVEALRKGIEAVKADVAQGHHAEAQKACAVLEATLEKLGPGAESLLTEVKGLSAESLVAMGDLAMAAAGKEWAGISNQLPGQDADATAQWDAPAVRAQAKQFIDTLPRRAGLRPRDASKLTRQADLAIAKANRKIREDNAAILTKGGNQAELYNRLERTEEAAAAAEKVLKDLAAVPAQDVDDAVRRNVSVKMNAILDQFPAQKEAKKKLADATAWVAQAEAAADKKNWVSVAQALEKAKAGCQELAQDKAADLLSRIALVTDELNFAKRDADGKKRLKDTESFADFAPQAVEIGTSYERGISKDRHAKLRQLLQVAFNKINDKNPPNAEFKDLLDKAEDARKKCVAVDIQSMREWGNDETRKRMISAHDALVDFLKAYNAYRQSDETPLDTGGKVVGGVAGEGGNRAEAPKEEPNRPQRVRCPACNGTGNSGRRSVDVGNGLRVSEPIRCRECGGTGWVKP